MKQTLLTLAICIAFTAINYSPKVSADTDCIGDATTFVCVDTSTGVIRAQGTNLITQGPSGANTNMSSFYISGNFGKIGAFNPDSSASTYLNFDSENADEGLGEITANAWFLYTPYDPKQKKVDK